MDEVIKERKDDYEAEYNNKLLYSPIADLF